MNIHSNVLELFNCVVLEKDQRVGILNTQNIADGYVTDFNPTADQQAGLLVFNKPLDVNTLFSREERMSAPLGHLLIKQVLHYVEVYGLGMPGLFDLEVSNGQKATVRYVKGISLDELTSKILYILYDNAPVKDSNLVQSIIQHYNIKFDVNKIQNNELKCLLFDAVEHTFEDGDDVVRYICYLATGSAMLIKSKEVVNAVKGLQVSEQFLSKHVYPLSRVFNRHKPIILALKKLSNKTVINQISRYSKVTHVPIRENIVKTFIHKAMTGQIQVIGDVLKNISIRDKMNYLNVLEARRQNFDMSVYNIRNGKMYVKPNSKSYNKVTISDIEKLVLQSLRDDFSELGLYNSKILLDPYVDYGLPISAKQTTGRVPNGTQISVDGRAISSGVYWENSWGCSDLDLSAVDGSGHRVGWGGYSGYGDRNIIYSGDITSAPNGAMEFLTSNKNNSYVIYVNVFNGSDESKCEIVVGDQSNDNWINNVNFREKIDLPSKQTILGFVKEDKFVVYSRRYSNSRVSSSSNGDINSYMPNMWTLRKLFDILNVNYDVYLKNDVVYDINLSYESFSFDKLYDVFK